MTDPTADYKALCRREAAGARLTMLPFLNAKPSDSGRIGPECLSQWYRCYFRSDHHRFSSAEQYMMWGKATTFDDARSAQVILGATNPSKIKKLGRGVTGFDAQEWARVSHGIVYRANLAKFGQNEELRDYLLSTKDRILVEASPVDKIWGAGISAEDERIGKPSQWPGTNKLGFILMAVRAKLAAESD